MRKKSNWRKLARAPKTSAAANEDDEDVVISDDDMDLLQEYGALTGFLHDLNPEELTRNEILQGPDAIMRAKGQFRIMTGSDVSDAENEEKEDDSEAEASYERRPRVIQKEWAEQKQTRLPIKSQDGRLMRQVIVPDHKDEPSEDVEKPEVEAPAKPVKNPKSIKKPSETQDAPSKLSSQDKAARFVEAQEKLASLASEVIENPEKNIGQLKHLRQIGSDKDSKIKMLAFLTQLAVYKDIIPGYRIRQLSEAEQGVKVSSDVKRLRQYEETLLSNFQAYLQTLENTIQAVLKDTTTNFPLLKIAIQCMADLLVSVPHFNYRLNIMTAVVARMTIKNMEISTICCNAISTLFQNDESGEASLEAVTLITKAIKSKFYNVHENVLKTFLHLRLNQDLLAVRDERKPADRDRKRERVKGGEKKRKRSEKHVSKKMRKVERHDKEIEAEMKEAEATYDHVDVRKRHTETLKFVFLTYFRILKNAPTSPLLPSVLEGLARFAHLINVEFFADLLEVLKKISNNQYQQYLNGDRSAHADTRSAFHCIIAAFQLLTGQGEALNLDLKDFYTSMYTQIMRLPMNPDSSDASSGIKGKKDVAPGLSELRFGSEIELALQGFELLFYKNRQIPVERVAAFVKRLAIVSLHLPAHATLACLAMIRSLIVRFPRLESLLDAEGRVGTGIYQPMLDDPELSNPFATSLWEMTLFMKHYHPTVAIFAKHVGNTIAHDQKGTAHVQNVHRPLPGVFAVPPKEFLVQYDPASTKNDVPDYRLVPAAEVPAQIKATLKRKYEKGIRFASGPSVTVETDFMLGLKEQLSAPRPANGRMSSIGR
ncbi:CBF/Mak21 family-domain-containing protein [Phlyctochytrium arcticum]|nr:CBF/Mak21 family-domain-containing protein [Phlyctochytrium arcticum]